MAHPHWRHLSFVTVTGDKLSLSTLPPAGSGDKKSTTTTRRHFVTRRQNVASVDEPLGASSLTLLTIFCWFKFAPAAVVVHHCCHVFGQTVTSHTNSIHYTYAEAQLLLRLPIVLFACS